MQSPTPEKCHCARAGFCPLYQKIMDDASVYWCQNARAEDRKQYQPSCRGSLALTVEADKFLQGYPDARPADVSNIQIAVLGHSKQQFDTIQDRPYLKKVYLDDLDLGKYHKRFQSNYFSESRAFLCDDLFDDDAEYVGVVTASWNIKYQGLNPIDLFHEWPSTKALLLSKRDNILLCADTGTTLSWFGQDTEVKTNVFKGLGFNDIQVNLLRKFIKRLGFNLTGRPSPNSHQFICHRNLYNRYIKFFREKEILPRVTNLWKKHDMVTHRSHTDLRPVGFLIECISMAWVASQEDVLVIPNEIRAGSWLTGSSPERDKE